MNGNHLGPLVSPRNTNVNDISHNIINLGNKRGGSHGNNLNGRGAILTPSTRPNNDKTVG